MINASVELFYLHMKMLYNSSNYEYIDIKHVQF